MSRRRRTPSAGPSTRGAAVNDCPCGLPKTYDECCGRLHRGEAQAASAEQLMRSRFTAFALRDADYLLRSWHPATRPADVDFDRAMRWVRLEIVATTGGSYFDTTGTVEFRAFYVLGGSEGRLHENSRFVRHEGAWVYLDGDTSP